MKQSAGETSLIHLTLQGAGFDAVRQALGSVTGLGEIARTGSNDNPLQIRISVPSTQDLREAIYQRIKATDWTLLEFYQQSRTLEPIFRELTKEK